TACANAAGTFRDRRATHLQPGRPHAGQLEWKCRGASLGSLARPGVLERDSFAGPELPHRVWIRRSTQPIVLRRQHRGLRSNPDEGKALVGTTACAGLGGPLLLSEWTPARLAG